MFVQYSFARARADRPGVALTPSQAVTLGVVAMLLTLFGIAAA